MSEKKTSDTSRQIAFSLRNTPNFKPQKKSESAQSFEQSWKLKSKAGECALSCAKLQPELALWITECRFHETISFLMDAPPARFFAFHFCLSGNCRANFENEKKPFDITSNIQSVFSIQAPSPSRTEFGTATPYQQASIIISHQQLFSWLESDSALRTSIWKKSKSEKRNTLLSQTPITPTVRLTLAQLLNCPFEGAARKLFLESRVLELMAHQLNEFTPSRLSNKSSPSLTPLDRKGVERAREYLLHCLDHPPSLSQLAKEAGMSPPKLNFCFRKAYGTTVFSWLREQRLNQAQQMLDQGLNVTDAAYHVGYSSLSHFARIFQKQFGYLPGGHHRKQ